MELQQQYLPTGEGVLPLLGGCWICSLCGDGGGSWGRELMMDGNRKGYTPGVKCLIWTSGGLLRG